MDLINYIQKVSEQFMPRRMCYAYDPYLIWMHISSDLMIVVAYYSIPIMIFHYAKRRKDLIEFKSIFTLFGLFIFLCGTTHIFSIINIWHPSHWVDGVIKFITGLVSLFTAYRLFYLIPIALSGTDTIEYERKLKENAEADVLARLLYKQLEKNE